MQLQKDYSQFKSAKLQIVGISYDPVDALGEFARQEKLEYLLLSDDQSKTIDAYGVRNKNVKSGSRQDGVPNPATVVIDTGGVIRAKLPGSIFRRHSTKALLDAVKKIE